MGERKTSMQERSINLLPLVHAWTKDSLPPDQGFETPALTWDGTHDIGMCPALELNSKPFGYRAEPQPASSQPHWPGPESRLFLLCTDPNHF